MADGEKSSENLVEATQRVLLGIFSWIFLVAISVIISGKLLGTRVKLGFSENDLFDINLLLFRLRARGDEVTLGFFLFILCLGIMIGFGGQGAYRFFRDNAGIDIGQWSSLCAMSSFLSIISAALCCVFGPIFRRSPLIESGEREQQIAQLRERTAKNDE